MGVAADNDSTALLAAVRRDQFLAASDDNWTDVKILGIADDCLIGPIAAALKSAKQDWFANDFDVALVASQAAYDLPEQAMFSSIENGFLIDKTTGRLVSTIGNISESQRVLHQSGNDNLTGTPEALWLNHTQLVLTPAPDSNAVAAYSMTVAAYREPGQLVLTSETVRVTAVNSVTQTLTTSARPSSWATDAYTSGTPYRVDVYNRNKPNTQKLWNQLVTAPSSTALVFSPSITAAAFALIAVGDVVTMKDTTPYVDLPRSGVPYLRRMIQKTIGMAQKDPQALQEYLSTEAGALANFMRGMSNRHDGKGKKISLYHAGTSAFMRRRW